MAYITDIRTANGTLAERFNAVVKAFGEAREQRRIYRATFAELSALSARELADLGISCSEIPYIAREAAYGRK